MRTGKCADHMYKTITNRGGNEECEDKRGISDRCQMRVGKAIVMAVEHGLERLNDD